MTGEIKTRPDLSDPLKDLGHLAAAVGHYVINAFSAIVSNAELLRPPSAANSEHSEADRAASSVVKTALAASHVARRLIDWTRQVTTVETNPGAPDFATVDLNRLASEMIELERATPGSRVEWALSLSPAPAVPGDVASLRRMLSYLIQNAREALPGGSGRVAFTMSIDPRNWLVLEIRDSGCGMSPEVLGRATEPFFSTKPGHAGIGLTIAQGIWRRHRGSLSIDSRPGQGTAIRLTYGPLPATAQGEPSSEEAGTSPRAEERPGGETGQLSSGDSDAMRL